MPWYRGDAHVHSVRSSGGELTADQLVSAAIAGGLDFIAITEHRTVDGHGDWTAFADELLVILGQEVTTQTGHWLGLGLRFGHAVEYRYGVDDEVINGHLASVRADGGLCVAAHPYAPYPAGTLEYPRELFDAIEVWNGAWRSEVPWQADNEAALAGWAKDLDGGSWRPAVGNSDAHMAGQIAVPHTVVYADHLTAASILDGIRAGRCWIADSPTVEITLTATANGRTCGIGEHLDIGGMPVTVRVIASGVPGGALTIHSDQGVIHQDTRVSAEYTVANIGLVRAELRHPDGRMAALTNPIFFR